MLTKVLENDILNVALWPWQLYVETLFLNGHSNARLKMGANSSVRFHLRAELLKPNHARSHGHASCLKGFIVQPVRD